MVHLPKQRLWHNLKARRQGVSRSGEIAIRDEGRMRWSPATVEACGFSQKHNEQS